MPHALSCLLITVFLVCAVEAKVPVIPKPVAPQPAIVEPAVQDPSLQDGVTRDPAEGKTVVEVVAVPVDTKQKPLPENLRVGSSADSITRILRIKAGQPFRAVDAREDLRSLWSRQQIRASIRVEEIQGGVRVYYLIEEAKVYDRHEFHGNDKYSAEQMRALLGIDTRQRLSSLVASRHKRILEDRYRRDGFYFARVELVRDDVTSTLSYFIDEGPEVEIKAVHFRGNRSFPGRAPVGLWDNLLGSARLGQVPGLFSGAAYSPEAVEEDLDKLRFYYRKQGYRDAVVELAKEEFTPDHTQVELTFRIFEGRRYRIASVELHQIPGVEGGEPLYPKAEILATLKTMPGAYYDQSMIDADKLRIEDYYGARGHPTTKYGTGIQNPFRVRDPVERFDIANAEIHLVFGLEEGTAKTLRDVRIQGNSDTRDFVIRRKVFIMPGEILDMVKVERSANVLDALRYFQDPETGAGVSFELRPVDSAEAEVDLLIKVQEGSTGSFVWGAGVSTNEGVQARFILSKRNFDIRRPPSSINPVKWITEIAGNDAFHGGGQDVNLMLAPGTERSLFTLSWHDPDIFSDYFDTIGMRVTGYRRMRFYDSYLEDTFGGTVGFDRNFTEDVSVGFSVRQENVKVKEPDPNAPTIVWDAEGGNELRGISLNAAWRELDYPLQPTSGFDMGTSVSLFGGFLGADEDFYKLGAWVKYYYPIHTDSFERSHVANFESRFDYGKAYGRSDDLFLTERFYLGGSTLRGFDQRQAGPKQFGQPTGGEVRYFGTLEYQFPLVSTKMEGRLRHTEILRGVVFSDWGLLGSAIDDPSFGEFRMSAGVGLRIFVPMLGVPIALDLGWPMLKEETDRQRQFNFSLSR